MEADLAKMRRYMLHHRIATYAIVLFLVLITFILISISKQVENEQALLLDSQASQRTTSRTSSGGTCPPSGQPFRRSYNGASSCYFGQYRSVSVRCNEGDRAKIIDASTVGSLSVCADMSVLKEAADKLCGCVPAPTNSAVSPTVVPTDGPIVVNPTGIGSSICAKGLKSLTMGAACAGDPGLSLSASYTCLGGKTGTVGNGLSCTSFDQFRILAMSACAKEVCNLKRIPSLAPSRPIAKPSPTSIVYPTFDPSQ